MTGGGGDGGAADARRAEEERQARIRAGTQAINNVFDGGWVSSGQANSFNPNQTYYTASGQAWDPGQAPGVQQGSAPRGFTGGEGGSDSPMAPGFEPRPQVSQQDWLAQQFAMANQNGGLYTGRERQGGFDDDFFAGRRQSFLDYATPQLDDQYADAQKQLTFSLARGGMLDSSSRGSQAAELQKLYDTQSQGIADQALSYETDARNAVEDARSDLVRTLQTTGDVSGAAQSAQARAQALTQQPAYQPLGQLFLDFTSGLGTQSALERANSMSGGAVRPRYNTGLFGTPSGAVQTRGA